MCFAEKDSFVPRNDFVLDCGRVILGSSPLYPSTVCDVTVQMCSRLPSTHRLTCDLTVREGVQGGGALDADVEFSTSLPFDPR